MSIWRSLREVEHPAYLRDRPQRRFHGAQCQLSCHQGTRPPWLSLSGRPPLASSRHRRRTQSGNPRQDLTEHPLRHRDLRHLEGEIAAVADHLRTNLDQHFPQCGHRPVLELLQQCQRPLRACAVVRRRSSVGASPTRPSLQPEATGAVMEVAKWLKPLV